MISDETLSAYLDNELPEYEREALQIKLEEDATLKARLDKLIRSQQALCNAFEALPVSSVEEILKQALSTPDTLDYLREHDKPSASSEASLRGTSYKNTQSINTQFTNTQSAKKGGACESESLAGQTAQKKQSWFKWSSISHKLAVAASIGCVVLLAALFAGRAPDTNPSSQNQTLNLPLVAGNIPKQSELSRLLNTQTSGLKGMLSGKKPTSGQKPLQLVILLSFVRENGQPCREFELKWENQQQEAIACLNRNQLWEVVLTQTVAANRPMSESGYEAASGGGDFRYENQLEMLMDDQVPLSLEEETDLIGREWKSISNNNKK